MAQNGPFWGTPRRTPDPDLPTGTSMSRSCRHELILDATALKCQFRFQITTALSVTDPGSGSKGRFFNRGSPSAEPVEFGISTVSGARFHPGVGRRTRDPKVAQTTPRPPQKHHTRGQNTPQERVSGTLGWVRSAVRVRQKAGLGVASSTPNGAEGWFPTRFGPVPGRFCIVQPVGGTVCTMPWRSLVRPFFVESEHILRLHFSNGGASIYMGVVTCGNAQKPPQQALVCIKRT